MKHTLRILTLTLALSGCAKLAPTLPVPTAPQVTWEQRQVLLNHIQSWWLNGKIAVQSRQESGSASLNWTQRLRQYTIAIAGPLGTNRMQLAGSPRGVTLQLSDGKTFSATSPEQLLASKWGFHLPVSNMQYWIRGLPAPNLPATTEFDQQARLISLNQQGWHIQYLSYAPAGGIDLPEKLSITSETLRVKMIVYQWRVA